MGFCLVWMCNITQIFLIWVKTHKYIEKRNVKCMGQIGGSAQNVRLNGCLVLPKTQVLKWVAAKMNYSSALHFYHYPFSFRKFWSLCIFFNFIFCFSCFCEVTDFFAFLSSYFLSYFMVWTIGNCWHLSCSLDAILRLMLIS